MSDYEVHKECDVCGHEATVVVHVQRRGGDARTEHWDCPGCGWDHHDDIVRGD